MGASVLPAYAPDPAGGGFAGLSLRQRCEIVRQQCENERSTFISHWRDLNDFFCPRRARFTTSDTNKGDKRNQKIVDSIAPRCVRTLQAGMMSGVSSPARNWFQLRTPDEDLNEQEDVKEWLYDVENRIHMVMARSKLTYPARRNASAIGVLPRSVAARMRGTFCSARIRVPSARISST